MCDSKIQKRSIVDENFAFILEKLHPFLDKDDMELLGVVVLNLWLRRNAVVYGKPNSLYNTVVSNTYNSLIAFKEANSHKLSRTIGENELRWEAPMDGFVKVNWDATVETSKKKMGIGVIIRYSKGEVLATLFELKDHIIASEIAETIAALRAINFSRELDFYKVILEGDALQIVQALGQEGSNLCVYGHLIEETKGILHNMQNWKVHHVRRNLNGAAHLLIRVALFLSKAHVCVEETPQCIYDIIVVERCT